MSATAAHAPLHCRMATATTERGTSGAGDADRKERLLARRHPISRWYLCPVAGRLAARLTTTPVRPVQLTACGLVAASCGAMVLVWHPPYFGPLAALAVWVAWFFDRLDGQLARRQGSVSAWGAWLDANVDELADIGLHVAVAQAAAAMAGSSLPWGLLIAFLAGKYLLAHGLETEKGVCDSEIALSGAIAPKAEARGPRAQRFSEERGAGWRRLAWHMPGNTDVRVHLLVVALLTGCLTAELAMVAVYYNLRWIARYALVARRLGGERP